MDELLTRKIGPLPLGGWLVGAAGIAGLIYVVRARSSATVTREVVEVPVPVGAIASPNNAPTFSTTVQHVAIPQFDALAELIGQQVQATQQNTGALGDNTGALQGATTAIVQAPDKIAEAVKTATVTTPTVITTSPKGEPYPGYWIQKGARDSGSNKNVSKIQARLNAKNNAGLAVDGVFGEKTRQAVFTYQRKHGLLVDGIVGPQTWGHLFS